MPRTSGPIFTNKKGPGSSKPPAPFSSPSRLSDEVVKKLEQREEAKNKEKQEAMKRRLKQHTLEALALKVAQIAAKRFVLTPLAFKYFGLITNMYNKAGGVAKMVSSKVYYSLANLVVTRLVNVSVKLLTTYITQLYKKAVANKQLKGKRFKLKVLLLKLRIAVKTGNFDSFVSFVKDSFLWPVLKTSKEFKQGAVLLKRLSGLRNPNSMGKIQEIIKTTADITKWSRLIKDAKQQKRIAKYSKALNKGLSSRDPEDDFVL